MFQFEYELVKYFRVLFLYIRVMFMNLFVTHIIIIHI